MDPVWLWQWQEGFQEVKATFRSALDRLNEYPEFVFTSSSAAYYEWVEQNEPRMFHEIKQRVAEGRWQIVGGWWVQPDCNLPHGESFVRQGLYGQKYFREKLGVTARVGYCVDSFGHFGMLPQILKKSGMDFYVFMRPSPHEKGLPGPLFWWEADDGSRVLTFRILYEYTVNRGLEKHILRCAQELKTPLDQLMCFYGVGNHGGGPTRENIETIRRLQREAEVPRLVFGSPNEFFETVEPDAAGFPVVHDELQHHASGCYAAHSGIKQWNRRAEHALLAAEKMSALAARVTGQPYPDEFARAWKNVLFNQFHDILAGTSIEAAYDDAREAYGEAMAIAARAQNYAVQALAWNIPIEPAENVKPLVVFNPHAWDSKVNVEVELGGWKEANGLWDDRGNVVPHQLVQSQATARGRYRLSFIAQLPALGYRTYRIVPEVAAASPLPDQDDTVEHHVLENERFRLELGAGTGSIRSLRDKKFALEVFLGEAAKPVVIDDPSDTWSHNVTRFDRVVGAFTAKRIRRVERGAVKSVLRVESEYGASRLIQDFTLYAELEQIDVHVTVDWREQFKMLKLRFPLNLNNMRAVSEIPYGHLERGATGEEEPGQSWLDVTGISRDTGDLYGLSILNDGKYSYDVNVRDIGFTILRSPIYAHHIPMQPDPDGWYSFIDQGIQHFTFTLLPHAGSWEGAGTVKRAWELNQRAIPLLESFHAQGTLAQADAFIDVQPENIVVSVLKLAEDNADWILRAYETSRQATDATIAFPKWGRLIQTHFAPCEIKTFRIPHDGTHPIVETNLLEA